jgi:hypothetical protein
MLWRPGQLAMTKAGSFRIDMAIRILSSPLAA